MTSWGEIRNMRSKAMRQSDASIRQYAESGRTFDSNRNETNGFRTTAARQLSRVVLRQCGATFGNGGGCTTVG